ncbi:MAG: hypothetical protein JXN65_06785 [Clostridia bacterium]|nr:hypothetical protein [Clostridia bacterium]
MKLLLLKKHFVIALSFVILLSFSGCASIVLRGEITPDYLAVYHGEAEIDLSNYDYSQITLAQESLLKLSEYWKSIGYESQLSAEGETYHLYFQKQVQCESYEDAFDKLFEMMTDEFSPFSSLSYEYTPYSNFSEYKIAGSIDTRGIIDSDAYETINDEIKGNIDEEMNNLDASIEFILPNQDSYSQPADSVKTFSSQILGETVNDFVFAGKIFNQRVAEENKDVIEMYQYYNRLKYILAIILVAFIILTITIARKMRKAKQK